MLAWPVPGHPVSKTWCQRVARDAKGGSGEAYPHVEDMTDPEEVPPFRGEEDYVTLDTEQGEEEQDPSAAQPESSEGTSEEEPHADWEVMQPPLAASAMTSRPEGEDDSGYESTSSDSRLPEASKPADEAADDSVPSSELDSQWQLAGDSDHDQDSGYSDLGSELDRASSPDPTLDALRFTSRQHGLAASSHAPVDLAQAAMSSPSQSSASDALPAAIPQGDEEEAELPAASPEEADEDLEDAELLSTSDNLQPTSLPSPARAASEAALDKLLGADAGEDVDEEACWPEDGKPRSRARGPAAFTHAALHSAWAWLQDLFSSVRDGLPLPVRQVGAALSRMDRSHLLGAGVAVLGTFLAAAAIRNKQLSHALRDKDRDMAQLVTKVFNLQHTLQSSRNIPIVRHTSSSCSFSFAGGGITGV